MPITTVLFDLGGVVCRFVPERRLALLAADCGLPPAEVHARLWESGFSRECDLGHYSAEQMYEEVRRRIGLAMEYAGFRSAWAAAFEPDDAVLAIVDAVADGCRTAMLTDNAALLDEALPLLLPDVARRFEPRLFSSALGACKPDVEIFRRALVRLGEPAADVLFVDDTPAAVEGGREAGLTAVLFTDAPSLVVELGQRLPDFAIEGGSAA
jgi:HAD superfamily hydrolase (TIGR01509 family)